MPEWMAGWPVVAVLAFFLLGALARSQALYWAGRGVAAGVTRALVEDEEPGRAGATTPPRRRRLLARVAASLDSAQVARARVAIERWGMPVVPLAFLTVGFQSAVFGATGLLRVGWLRFTLWALPGAVAWSLVWGGGGMAAVAGVLAAARRSPATLALVLAAAGVVVTVVSAVVRRRRATRTTADRPADVPR